ncbi:hypothetical protein FZ103_03225 [Streptomonospora sp. PA3]|uniref:hypothetical protein n=1 Tax=Streptomonospora sp. PA3 TaxID=2607326 RepID=UPI0012DEA11B|nr:hypothetical protein [Streptomonospora sp. PA3]MUL40197.1 hypothetical protein [Streptomonospora sp. PA3]
MTEPPEDPIEERLRAILRAEADSVDPSPEALNAIRARTQRTSWLTALVNASWLRPSLAVGAAALIACSVLLGTPQVRDQILPQSLTTPTEDTQTPPEDGGGSEGAETEPGRVPPRPDPAERPSGGADPTSGPAAPDEPDSSAVPFGTTEHCATGSSPAPDPQPSATAGTGGTGDGQTSGDECASSGDPVEPSEEPPPQDPGDGSTGDSTPPPAGGGDTGGDGGDTPTTAPDTSAGAGADTGDTVTETN